jgi:hypothetical protein
MAGQLTVNEVKNAEPGWHGDGLYLEVKPGGRAEGIFRFMLDGNRHDMGLGSAKGPGMVTLPGARGGAAEAHKLSGPGRTRSWSAGRAPQPGQRGRGRGPPPRWRTSKWPPTPRVGATPSTAPNGP